MEGAKAEERAWRVVRIGFRVLERWRVERIGFRV